MSDYFDLLVYNSLAMTIVSGCYLLLLAKFGAAYSAKWKYGISIFILTLWVIPYRPRLQFPAMMAEGPQALPMLLPSMVKEAIRPSVLPEIELGAQQSLSWGMVLCALWLTGMTAVAAVYIVRQWRFRVLVGRWSIPVTDHHLLGMLEQVREEVHIKRRLPLKLCKGISTPMLFGLWSTVILLPDRGYDDEELYYILKHECIHYKDKDLYIRLLICVATIVHFFNPVMWLMARVTAIQCELACDERVMEGMGAKKRKDYGRVILQEIERQRKERAVLSTYFYGGAYAIKSRITAIVNTKRRQPSIMMLGIVMSLVVIAACSPVPTIDTVTGYIVFEGDELNVDQVEIITPEDSDRVLALGLLDTDMPNGYYILNTGDETSRYKLTEQTVYSFVDFNLLFVGEEQADGDRRYETTDRDEFLRHLYTSYADDPPAQRVPFVIRISAGKVVSIREELLYTI